MDQDRAEPLDSNVAPYASLKVIAGFLSTVYCLAQAAQLLLLSLYMYYNFGYYYYPAGIVINSLLCCIRFLTPTLVISICNNIEQTAAKKRKKYLCCLIFITVPCIIGGAAGILVLHGYISTQTGNDGSSAIMALICVGVDAVAYFATCLVGNMLGSAIAKHGPNKIILHLEEESENE